MKKYKSRILSWWRFDLFHCWRISSTNWLLSLYGFLYFRRYCLYWFLHFILLYWFLYFRFLFHWILNILKLFYFNLLNLLYRCCIII